MDRFEGDRKEIAFLKKEIENKKLTKMKWIYDYFFNRRKWQNENCQMEQRLLALQRTILDAPKIYCKNCKYYEWMGLITTAKETCHHPNNIRTLPTGLEVEAFKPIRKNKNCDCDWFEPGISDVWSAGATAGE